MAIAGADEPLIQREEVALSKLGMSPKVMEDLGGTMPKAPGRHVRFCSRSDVYEATPFDEAHLPVDAPSRLRLRRRPTYTQCLKTPSRDCTPKKSSKMARTLPLTLLFAFLLVLLHYATPIGRAGTSIIGVKGGMIKPRDPAQQLSTPKRLQPRASSPTTLCTRWSQQAAIVNGTLYIYGGQATNATDQTSGTWNNNFLTLDLSNSWEISNPSLTGLPQPSGPPAVANGYLWNSYDSLFLYGGEYSDHPVAYPPPFSLWEYNIASSSWIEHMSPTTSSGVYSDPGGQPVQDSAEGAGISVPSLGRGWFFGGHLDGYTTNGWSQSTARVYLKSMIEYTFPGYSNPTITSTSGPAGSDGLWRNITLGGLQAGDGFPERADGVLIYVPGFGEQGIIVGLAGGNNESFAELNELDVFDIATSEWYKQATNGTTPQVRVNPCAVAASAEDGSSTNIYLYGGQNLIPYGNQTQYSDIWILTLPSFTWIPVDTSGQSVPLPRAGHTCNIWNGQIVVFGGYVGQNIECDSPGVYVFDASNLKWVNSYTALGGGDAQNQQSSQSGNNTGLSGSYGYSVPDAVISVIGGAATGGATVTAPALAPTGGPLATGSPIIYTITASGGAVVTETSSPSNGGGNGGSGSTSNGSSGINVAAIVAGVVAGVFFVIACYLGFCAYVYRRQLQLYKNHVAMAQRAAAAGPNEKTGFLLNRDSQDPSNRGTRSTDQVSGPSGAASKSAVSASGNSDAAAAPPMPLLSTSHGGYSTANTSTEDLNMTGQEPSFIGVLLSPRRSLRVINRD